MKKIAVICTAVCAGLSINVSAFAQGCIADHKGTSMDGIDIGTVEVGSLVKQYFDYFKAAGDQYGVDPNLLAAVCMQESSGRNLSYREDGSSYPAWGIMQIEYTMNESFGKFGYDTTGVYWTPEDRLDPQKSINYAAHLISGYLIKYDCDYLKMLTAYNYGSTVLDRIVAAKGDDWLSERVNSVNYVTNWPYSTYGDAQYVEHVLRYYHNYMDYAGAKIRVNGTLVSFEDQYPIIKDERTLIPVRGLLERLGAQVDWDENTRSAVITKDNKEVTLPIGKKTAYIDGNSMELEVEAQLINGRTMVPLRFITDAFGIEIDWEQDTRTVNIEY
ncbi:MAG: stalk domain-containing protein [Clostridiales bacterium]|nr:stalk domain-containing protein [Clostridiales bacterium]